MVAPLTTPLMKGGAEGGGFETKESFPLSGEMSEGQRGFQQEAKIPPTPLSERGLQDIKNIFDYIFTGRKLDYELVKKYYFFVEACEYQRHFLHLDLDAAIITNITLDHTDYFKDLADYELAFEELVKKVKHHVFVLPDFRQKAILNDKKTIVVEQQHFDFQYIRGEHQQKNASLVAGLLQQLKGEEKADEVRETMEQFRGIWRRMEFLKET